VKKEVLDARKRGVKVRHRARQRIVSRSRRPRMLANGFLRTPSHPTASSYASTGPAFDQVTTMSKFLCMGMELPDVIACLRR
jgi:dihydroorotase